MPPFRTTRGTRTGAFVRTALVGAETLTGAGAVYGAVMLVIDGWHLPVSYLHPLPLHSWVLPGVALGAVVAVPMLTAAALAALDTGGAAHAAVIAGLVLTGWILVQLAVVGPRMVLQPVMLAIGLTIAAVGLWWQHISRHS